MRIHLKAVDSLTLIFTGLLSALTLLFLNSIPRAGWLLSRYGMVLVVVTGLAIYATQPRAGKALLTFRDFFPVLVILILFDSLGDLLPWVRPRVFDEGLIGIDHALFGVHPTVWMERFIHPLLTAVLQFAYISYYPMAVVLGVTLAVRQKGKEFDEDVFGIALCFYLSYIGYLAVPAIGPRFTLADIQNRSLDAGPFILAIQETLNTLENTKMDAFPSGHTAVALMTDRTYQVSTPSFRNVPFGHPPRLQRAFRFCQRQRQPPQARQPQGSPRRNHRTPRHRLQANRDYGSRWLNRESCAYVTCPDFLPHGQSSER